MGPDQVNYPDLLGAITGGIRLSTDVIQCALAIRPAQVPAGRFLEIIFLLQNASDIDVDVTVEAVLPERDAAKQPGRFAIKSKRLLVGLRPAEVGYVSLPVLTSPKTAAAPGYSIGMNINIKRLSKNPQRVREPYGGGQFIFQELPADTQKQFEALRTLRFSMDTGGRKNYLQAPFEILPPAVSGLKELKAEWVSLWTMRDYTDDYTLAQKVWPQSQAVVRQLTRENVFMPLMKTNQARFATCQYTLQPPEAIYITKIQTLVLEQGILEPTPIDPRPPWPRWFGRLCRLLVQEPALAHQIEPLTTRLLYGDLVYDSIQHAFTMLSTVMNEDFGSPEEINCYAEDIVGALLEGRPLDFARTYLPMVLGGLIANARVTMPHEQIRETAFILSKAVDNRRPFRNADNDFIFEMTDKLVERALDAT